MGRKSRTNRSKNRIIQRGPSRALINLETIFERKTSSQIWEGLKAKYRGDVPPEEIWNHLADRRQSSITVTSGAGLIARG